jgi:hypothetical protein
METGTFISRDPLGLVDGPNVYCYVRQNPWTHWDPEGLALEKAEREALEKDYEQAASRYKAIGGKPSTVDMVKRDHHAPDSPDDWSYRFNFTHPWDSVQEKYGSNYSIDDAALAYATEQTKSWTQVKQAQLGDKGSQRAVALRVYGVALDLVADTTQLVAGPEAVVSSLAKSAGRAVVGVSANVTKRVAANSGPARVFWSGGDEARLAAEAFAGKSGGVTLEMTAAGQRLQQITKGMDWADAKPLWEAASANFARGATGTVNVFQHGTRGVSLESVWRGVEYPLLKQQGNGIIYNVTTPLGPVKVP